MTGSIDWNRILKRFAILVIIAIGLSCITYGCARAIEGILLDQVLGLPYELRIPTLTPIIEEALKILPFLLAVYLLRRYRGIEITKGWIITGLFLIGFGFGLLEGTFSHGKSGFWLALNGLIHGSMTGFAGFIDNGIFLSILLHTITNSIIIELMLVWQYLVITAFFIGAIFFIGVWIYHQVSKNHEN